MAGPPGISITSPANNAVLSNWSPSINWNQGGSGGYDYSSCQYSFGTSTDWNAGAADWNDGSPESGTWQGASCTGIGADISAPPSDGTQLFVIRAFYNGTATSTMVTIDSRPRG